MRFSLFAIAFLISTSALAQISLGRQVIGSAIIMGGSEVQISSSAGEVVSGTASANNVTVTQGFQQPADRTPLIGELAIGYDECWNGNNAFVDVSQLSGCGDAYELIVTSSEVIFDASALPAGSYEVEVIAEGGCTETFSLEVIPPLVPPCDLFIPNTITPNGDGLNDLWQIVGLDHEAYAENTVTIVDRWGRQVWRVEGYGTNEKFWFGQDQEENELIEGVYYYQIELPDGQSFTGFINLLR